MTQEQRRDYLLGVLLCKGAFDWRSRTELHESQITEVILPTDILETLEYLKCNLLVDFTNDFRWFKGQKQQKISAFLTDAGKKFAENQSFGNSTGSIRRLIEDSGWENCIEKIVDSSELHGSDS